MPILDDIMDHDLFGPAIRQGREEGREEGLRHERHILTRQMVARFGPVPTWVKERLNSLSSSEIEEIAIRLLDASSLEDLLP